MASNNKSVEKEAFLNQTTITAVSFGKDCKTVEESAFKNCSELSNINNDNKIENIGAYAFAHVSLINVSLPKAEIIGNNAFEGCSKLTNITINNNCSFIGKGAFKDCEKLESVRIPNNNKFKTISENTFQNCAIPSITIPNNVTTIGNGAFNGCGKLSSVTFDLDSHVVNIGNLAFNECSSIKSISIPNTTTNIGYGAFRECESLTSAIIGNSVTNIQGEAFNGCIGLTNINIPNSVTTIGSVAFARCSGLTTISIGDNVKNIGNDAFKGCNKIGSIYINNIANWCGINFGNEYANPLIYSTTSTYLYEKNKKLTDIDIPNSVSNIKSNVFYNYKNLNRIILASTVTSIGNNAFNGCENLKTVINLTSLPIIKGNEDNGHVAKYASRVVKGTSRINDFIFNKESNKNNELVYHLKSDVTDIRLPSHTDGKYDISDRLFVEHTKLTKFTIPDNTVASIGERVFEGCEQLTDVSIGDGVTNIGNYTFNGCSSLKNLIINDNDDGSSDSESPIIEIGVEPDTSNNNVPLNLGYEYDSYNSDKEGRGLFRNCPLKSVYLGRNITYETDKQYGYSPFYGISTLTSVSIGNSVTEIGENVFSKCGSITSVTIPNNIINIGDYAFCDCRGLKTVFIGSGVTSIGKNAFYIYDNKYNISSVYISNFNNWCNIDFKNESSNPLYYERIDNLYLENIKMVDKHIDFPNNIKKVKNYTFMNWDGLITIKLPDNIESIGDFAFYNCQHLKSIELPNGVESIGESAFYNCHGLTSITIPNSVTSIGADAFAECYCKVYTSGYNIPAGWCKINFANGGANPASISGGFHNIENQGDDEKDKPIENIIIPDGVETIGSYAFYKFKYTKSIIIPNSVTSIGEGVFKGCGTTDYIEEHIKRMVIGNSVETIGESAFGSSSNYNESLGFVDFLVIGKNTPKLNNNIICFPHMTHSSITILNFSKNKYEYSSISNASITKEIYIPDAEPYDGDRDFMFDSNDDSHILCGYMGAGVGTLKLPNYYGNSYAIGDYVFYNCDMLTDVTIPNYVTNIGIQAFCGCSGLERIVVEAGNENYDSRNNCNAIIKTKADTVTAADTLIQGCKNTIIPDGVKKIGNYAFYNCDTLTNITIPSSVEKIEEFAFWGCKNLKTVINRSSSFTIEKGSVDNGYVGKYADVITNSNNTTTEIYKDFIFNINEKTLIGYTGNETELILPENYKGYKYKIGEQAFWNNKNITSVIIPNSVTSIGVQAFQSCINLNIVAIGNSVTSIGEWAFKYCDALKTVINLSSHLTIEMKSDDYGYVGKNADKVINAPNGSIEGDFVFDKPNGVKTLVAYIGKDTEITLPSNYNDENYVIGESVFENNKTITKIIIPNGVTSIGYNAFLGCENLKTVINHSSSFTIEKGSVDNGYVGKYAETVENTHIQFDKNFVFEVSEGVNILKGYTGTETELVLPTSYYGENYVIGAEAFKENNTLTSVTIPDSVTSIGYWAFEGCIGLTSVTIGNNVTNIGEYAFGYCTSLTSITIPNSVTSIENEAFSECSNLAIITIPNSVISIGYQAFEETKWYNNQPDGVVYAGKVLYGYKGNMPENTSINIENGTLGIAGGAFEGYTNLINIAIPNSITNIGTDAFIECSIKNVINCSSLEIDDYAERVIKLNVPYCTIDGNFVWSKNYNNNTLCAYIGNDYYEEIFEVELPENYNGGNYVIGESVFRDCINLINVTIPNSVTSIGNYAFDGCYNLTSVTIPNSVTSIGNYAFGHCTYYDGYNTKYGLKNVIFNDGSNLENIGNYAFYDCDYITNISIPNKVNSIGLYAFSKCGRLDNITLPNNISTISNYTFYECVSLTNITIPNSVISIGEGAFYDCRSLASITIPNSVTSIGIHAFNGCYGLTSITIPNSVTSIGNSAFNGCSGLTSITIPNSVTSIGDEAFYGCDLTNAVIGNNYNTNIEYIGYHAFYNNNTGTNGYPVLKTVHLYAKNAPRIGEEVFWVNTISNRRTEIHVPEDSNGYTVNDWKVYYDKSMIKFDILDIQEST